MQRRRRGKSAKFDGAGVYLLILHMASAVNFLVSPLVGVLCDKEKDVKVYGYFAIQ